MVLLRVLRLQHSCPTRFPVFNLSRSSSSYSSENAQETPSYATIPTVQRTAASANTNHSNKEKKPLDIFFKEAVGLIERAEEESNCHDDELCEVGETSKKLRALERELKNLSVENLTKRKLQETQKRNRDEASGVNLSRLRSLFAEPSKSDGKGGVSKELLLEMVSFVSRLYKGGYLNDGNFTKDGELDLDCLSRSYSYDYLKFAAERFGQDHQELAKRLSAGDLKKVALVGCPSLEKRTVLAAKNLRSFFCVQESTVCQPCKLKSLCKYSNQRVKKNSNLDLRDALRLLTAYGLDSLPQQLTLSDDIRLSISKLLKEAVRLGR